MREPKKLFMSSANCPLLTANCSLPPLLPLFRAGSLARFGKLSNLR